MKTKHFFCGGKGAVSKQLEKRINDFIRDKKVVDIKYSSSLAAAAANNYGVVFKIDYSVLIMYED